MRLRTQTVILVSLTFHWVSSFSDEPWGLASRSEPVHRATYFVKPYSRNSKAWLFCASGREASVRKIPLRYAVGRAQVEPPIEALWFSGPTAPQIVLSPISGQSRI